MSYPKYYEQVYEIVSQIPYGKVTTYGSISDYLASGSARIVGSALRNLRNTRLTIPAHRVVNAKGVLTGRRSFDPPELMAALLRSEGIHVEDHTIKNLEDCLSHPDEFM